MRGVLEVELKDRLEALIGEALQTCEAEIERELGASPVPLIRDLASHVALAGGKRLRPILVLLCARLAGGAPERAARLGSVVELLHTATLIHDDVVDHAPRRRGRASANARWGDDASVLVGDHLYARCMARLVEDGDVRVMDALARAMVSMTEAEVFQLQRKREGRLGEEDYLRIVRLKTATFMAACCRVGGLLGALPASTLDALGEYGEQLGIAFQIIDDCLDFAADEGRLGKAVGADLREGKRTLPLIATLARAAPGEQERILAALAGGADEPAVAEICRLVRAYDGVGYAVAQAATYAARARAELARVPAGGERDALELLAEYVIRRDH